MNILGTYFVTVDVVFVGLVKVVVVTGYDSGGIHSSAIPCKREILGQPIHFCACHR